MDDVVAEWLAEHAVPLDAVGLSSWQPALDGVRVLGVGAAAHGTRELTEVGSRLVQFAVEYLGTRVVVLGASEAGATVVDAAVRGIGPPGEAVAALGGWEYDTRGVVDLVSLLRDANESLGPDDRIRVVGADPVRGAPSVKALGSYLRAAAPDLLPAVRESLAELLDRDPDARPLAPKVHDDLVGLPERLAAEETRLVAESTADQYAEARHHAEILARVAEPASAPRVREPQDAAQADALPEDSAPVVRALLTAETVERAAEGAAGTVAAVFWGHDDQVRVGDPTTAGRYLRDALGEAYYAVGGLFGEGGTSAVRRRLLRAPRPRPTTHKLPRLSGTLEAELRTALGDAGARLVDLRGADEAAAQWAREPTATRRLGSVVDSGQLRARTPVVPAREYDGLALVPQVQPARIR
jgi:erythromycin esterase